MNESQFLPFQLSTYMLKEHNRNWRHSSRSETATVAYIQVYAESVCVYVYSIQSTYVHITTHTKE